MIQNNEQNYFENGQQSPFNDFTQPASPFNGFLNTERNIEFEYKKKIKAAAACVGAPILLLVIFSVFWKNALFFITDSCGISRKTVSDFFASTVNQNFFSVLISSFLFVFVFSVCMKAFGKKISALVAFGRAKKGTFFPLVLIGTAFCMFANYLNLEFESFFESFGTKYSVGSSKPEITILSFVTTVIATAVIPAFTEEYACRGLIMGTLLPYGEGFALLASAVLFGLMHGNFEQIPFAFLVGIILGYIRIKSGSMWPCILVHMLNNLFSVVAEFSGYILPNETRNFLYFLIMVSTLLAGTVCSFVFTQKDGALSLDNGSSGIGEAKKFRWFFISPFIIIAIISYIGLSFKYFG